MSDWEKTANDLVHRFEVESMALHRIQREWLQREIKLAISAAWHLGALEAEFGIGSYKLVKAVSDREIGS